MECMSAASVHMRGVGAASLEVTVMDTVSTKQRSRNMAAVRSRNTQPERIVRSVLHCLGLRFRIHGRDLPSVPDIVLKRHGAVVLVHGCFWHRHSCARGRPPGSRREFWLPKLAANCSRDERQVKELRSLGWRVLTIWECETKDRDRLARRLAKWFHLTSRCQRGLSMTLTLESWRPRLESQPHGPKCRWPLRSGLIEISTVPRGTVG